MPVGEEGKEEHFIVHLMSMRGPIYKGSGVRRYFLNILRECVWVYAGSRANVASLLLWYGVLGALCASLGAWIVFLTGQIYTRIQPKVPEVKTMSCTCKKAWPSLSADVVLLSEKQRFHQKVMSTGFFSIAKDRQSGSPTHRSM